MKISKKSKHPAMFLIIVLIGVMFLDPSNIKAKENAFKVVEDMAPGWNLAHSFDAIPDETAWGNPVVTKELIHSIKQQGFRSIRIPITFFGHYNEKQKPYEIEEEFLNRLDTVINYALDEDLYVVINMQNDSWKWIANMQKDKTVLPKYSAIWKQLATRYKNYSSKLIFEALSQPNFEVKSKQEEYELLDKLQKEFVKVVRGTKGKNTTRILVLSTLDSTIDEENCEKLSKTMKSLSDSNLVAAFHYNGEWGFSVNAGGKTKFSEDVKKDITAKMDLVYEAFVRDKIPVIITEYGLLGLEQSLDSIEHGEMLQYMEYINYYAKKKNITLMLWDKGQFIDRNSYQFIDSALASVLDKAKSERSSFADEERLMISKETIIKDHSVTLVENGNKFKSLSYRGTSLKEGSDYTYKDKKIVLDKSLIARILAPVPGSESKLTIHFDKGADASIICTFYQQAKLEDSVGRIQQYYIPCKFNGERLLTLEALYEDGKTAGPLKYTTYQEFGYAYMPDYENDRIGIEEDFLKQLKEGDITLKLHFQSGDIQSYTITKKGPYINGASPTYMEDIEVTPSISPSEEKPVETQQDIKQTNSIEKFTLVDYIIMISVVISIIALAYYVMKKRKSGK